MNEQMLAKYSVALVKLYKTSYHIDKRTLWAQASTFTFLPELLVVG